MEKQKIKIFEHLFKNNICFAVCVNYIKSKNVGIEGVQRDYFIIAWEGDIRDIDGFVIGKERMIEHDYVTYTLSLAEETEFKSVLDKFKEVVNSEDGRIYELAGNSLKEHLKTKKLKPYERV